MRSPNFIYSSPQKILSSYIPATWKMTNFLIFSHIFYFLRFVSSYIEEHIPFVIFSKCKSIKLQRVNNAFILPAIDFVFHLEFGHRVDSIIIMDLIRNRTYSRILKENRRGSTLEFTSFHMNYFMIIFLQDTIICLFLNVTTDIQLIYFTIFYLINLSRLLL